MEYPVDIYLVKFNNGNTRIMCKICLELTIKTPERYNHRDIIHDIIYVKQVPLLLTLNRFTHCAGVSIVAFDQENDACVAS